MSHAPPNPPPGWSDQDLDATLVHRFARVVAAHGSRIAVFDGQAGWSYAELNARANAVAAALPQRSEESPRGVALLVAPGRLFAAAVWGVLKSGGFYIPLDPAYPEARLREILAHEAASLLIADAGNADRANTIARTLPHPVEVIVIGDEPAPCFENPPQTARPDDLCCVIFTSGSTGNPKGVCHTHRNLLHSTKWYSLPAGLDHTKRMSMLHPVSAVAAATAFFGAHLNGATLVPGSLAGIGIDHLAGWIDHQAIDVLHVVPTLLRRLAGTVPDGRRLASVTFLRLGGEGVTVADWRAWRRIFHPEGRMLTCLGSTEALNYRQAVYAHNDPAPSGEVLPVGDPMPDKEVLVVDDHGRPVPPGATGEIVVRSPYIFTGYWRQPGLTARLMTSDPRPGWRCFHTGDLGVMDDSGALRHAGRNDHLVKIMGHRVHPADAESVIRRLPGVQEAAVLAVEDGDGTHRLVAFVVAGPEGTVTAPGVRAFAASHLPAPLVPARVALLKALPLLPGGKIDRAALARLAVVSVRPFVAPRNPYEETLAEIWRRHLQLPALGIEDDLFADGGADSMAAASIAADVHEVFGRALPLHVLYSHPTVATLAGWLRSGAAPVAETPALVVHARGARPPVFGVCGAFGHAMRLLLIGRGLPEEQPLYGLEPPDMDWHRAGCFTVEDFAAWYVAHLRRIQPEGPYRLLGTSFGGVIVHDMARQLQRDGQRVALLAMVDTNPPDCLDEAGGIDRALRRDWAAGMHADDPLVNDGIRIARQHREALDRFVLRECIEGSITYFWCEERVDPDERDRRLMWRRFASGGLDIVRVPGKHGLFHTEPQCSAIVDALRARLG